MRLPATQHDAWPWIAGGARNVVFDSTLTAIQALAPLPRVASATNGWVYQHDRDLTGFIDGTENPSILEAPRSGCRAGRHERCSRPAVATPPLVGGAAGRRPGAGDRSD